MEQEKKESTSKNHHHAIRKLTDKRKSIFRTFSMLRMLSSGFWFFVGFSITALFTVSFIYVFVQKENVNRIYPGIFIDALYVGGEDPHTVQELYSLKNKDIAPTKITLTYQNTVATISAGEIGLGYNDKLLSDQAYSLGRSNDLLTNAYLIANSWISGTTIHTSYMLSPDALHEKIKSIQDGIYHPAVDALFTVKNGRVTAFRQSKTGKSIDYDALSLLLEEKIPELIKTHPGMITITIPVTTTYPTVTTEQANNFGIVELLGEGTSEFHHSIPNRIDNIALAASKMNGVLVKPGETFSFDKTLGDVSKYTGYKEAYVIQNGKTVLGDGGGVCQVSTTLFRAILNAGLPVVERHAHAYRVGYYEQDAPIGLDATIYAPTVDLKFKNDTGSYILILTKTDTKNDTLAFDLYGKSDGRKVVITKPVVTNQSPPPPAKYQDDPSLPVGTIQQVDFAAWGANVYFTRKVTRNGQTIISDTFSSHYTPWQAVYLRGTKTG